MLTKLDAILAGMQDVHPVHGYIMPTFKMKVVMFLRILIWKLK